MPFTMCLLDLSAIYAYVTKESQSVETVENVSSLLI